MSENVRAAWLLGSPVAHSVSPPMHNAAYRAMALSAIYQAAEVPPERLGETLQRLSRVGFLGVNLTLPLKEAALEWMDRLEEPARALGAVNTVRLEEGRLVGSNTDAAGWLRAWDHSMGQALTGRSAVLLGAGGAARAITWALASRGARRVLVLNRTLDRAVRLVEDLQRSFPRTRMEAAELGREPFEAELVADAVVVNCTSVGMHPETDETPVPWPRRLPWNVVVCELVYNPPQTRFLSEARRAGAQVLGGLDMLVHQAAAAIELWTGRKPPLDVMRQAAVEALAART